MFSEVFWEREKGTRKKKININGLPPIRTLTGNQTYNLGMCPDQELNTQPLGVQDDVPTNQATQPELLLCF